MIRASAELSKLFARERKYVLARVVRVCNSDFDLAEEALADAFAAAMVQWPRDGLPEDPRAWLCTVARNKAVDRIRKRSRHREVEQQIAATSSAEVGPVELGVSDDMLRLIFTCCHPALAFEAQIALTLHTIAGLATHEIARSFLVPVETMAQRLVRAKKKIVDAKIPYRVPDTDELSDRIGAVCEVIYFIFNEGYAATDGERWVKDELCRQALSLGELLVDLCATAQTTGLLALMLLHDARRSTRSDGDGNLVLLEKQDRSRWDRAKIVRGCDLVALSLQRETTPIGIEAAIAALHAQAPRSELTDWKQIVGLYDELIKRQPSPVAQLNRAVARSNTAPLDEVLAELHALESALGEYHLYHSAVAEFLRRCGDHAKAIESYRTSLALATCEPERKFLLGRIRELGGVAMLA